jgi:hypothetical protein
LIFTGLFEYVGTRGKDTASRGKDTASRGKDTASRGKDTASRGKDTASRGKDTAMPCPYGDIERQNYPIKITVSMTWITPLSASISAATTVAFFTSKPSEQSILIGEPSREVTKPSFAKSAFINLPETT